MSGAVDSTLSGSTSPLRQRARSILCTAYENGRLETALAKPDVFLIEEDADSPNERRVSSLGPARRGRADTSDSQCSEPFTRKKPKAKGIEAAMKLAVQQHAIPEEPVSPAQSQAAKYAPVPKAIADAEHKAAEEARAKAHEKQRRKKFAEAERQAEAKRIALELHEMRTRYIHEQLKPLLAQLVAGVSVASERPDNPVPLLIELLSEVAGKHPSYYANATPAQRLAREVMELQKDIADLQDKIDRGSEYETDDGEGDGEDPMSASSPKNTSEGRPISRGSLRPSSNSAK